MSEDSGTVEEITVVGERIRRVDPSPGFGGEITYSVYTPTGYVPFDPFSTQQIDLLFQIGPPVETPNTPTVRVDPSIPKDSPDYPRALADAMSIQEQIPAADTAINAVADNETVFMARENTMTGAQLKALWYEINYVVTTQTFGAGRGGEVVTDAAGHSTSYVNVMTIEGYQSSGGEYGTNYYLLHELAHTTTPVSSYNQSQFGIYLDRMSNAGTPDPNGEHYYENVEGIEVEKFANNTAQQFANLAGISLWANPPYGYTYP